MKPRNPTVASQGTWTEARNRGEKCRIPKRQALPFYNTNFEKLSPHRGEGAPSHTLVRNPWHVARREGEVCWGLLGNGRVDRACSGSFLDARTAQGQGGAPGSLHFS